MNRSYADYSKANGAEIMANDGTYQTDADTPLLTPYAEQKQL